MSDIIIANANGVEQPPVAYEFFVNADQNSIIEIRLTKDVDFILRTYVGLGEFISRHLNPPVTLAKFLRDLADVVDATEALRIQKEGTPPSEPEVA